MKLPNGNPPPPQTIEGLTKTARPASPGQPTGVDPSQSARVQLEQLNLANRQTTLARVAEVIKETSANAGRLLLDIRGQNLSVNAAIGETSLETGDWVKVMRAGNELRLLGKLAPAAESTVARALAQRLPWQQSLDAGLARVLSSAANGLIADPGAKAQAPVAPLDRAAQPLPTAVRQAIEQLTSLLPDRKTLTDLVSAGLTAKGAPTQPSGSGGTTTPQAGALAKPEAANQIKQWIEQSGLFAESRVARAPDSPPSDLKLALGRLIQQLLAQQGQNEQGFNKLTPIPNPNLAQSPLQFPGILNTPPPQVSSEPTTVGQMLRLLAGVLNRITVNQLHSQVLSTRTTADAPTPNTTLLLDLPWLNQDNEPRTVQLRIEEQAQDQEAAKKTRARMTEWKLSLAMNLDDAGPLHFDVALGQGQVSAQVWAEKQNTLKQAQEELPELRRSLTDLGLEVVDLECRRGIPRGATTQLEHRLVDTKA